MPREILFLAHRVPYPPDKGDRIRSFHLLQHLWAQGRVHLGFLTDEPVTKETTDYLTQNCARVTFASVGGTSRWARASFGFLAGRSVTDSLFWSRKLQRKIDDWITDTNFDVIVCFSSAMLQYLAGRGLERRVIADLVDVDSQKWFDYATQSRPPLSWLFRIEGHRVRRIETAAARNSKVVLITRREADIYHSFCSADNVSIVTNGIDLKYFEPRAAPENLSCIFVGYLDYRANVLGLQWFCQHVWPRLREKFSTAVFRIVGRNAVPAVKRLAVIPGVELVGEVPDVRPEIAAATVVVVPLTVARGIQNKVLEAMSMGKPVIVSPTVLNGITATPGQDLICAANPDDWIDSIKHLWTDHAACQKLGQSARRFTELHHNWQTCLTGFADLNSTLSQSN